MNKVIVLLFFWGTSLIGVEYKTAHGHAQGIYNTILTHCLLDTACNGQDYVKTIMNDGTLTQLFSDALADGYPRYEIIRIMYAIAIRDKPTNPIVVEGLRDYIVRMYRTRTIALYSGWILTGLNSLMSIYCIHFFIRYFEYNLPDLTTYY